MQDMHRANKELGVLGGGGFEPKASVVAGPTGRARCIGSRFVRVSQPCASVGLLMTHSYRGIEVRKGCVCAGFAALRFGRG
jgi:hypothetical protein